MSGNPLENDPARDNRIRERAYHLWESEGRPHGRHDEFWERARELVGMEESAGSGQLPNPQASGQDPAQEQVVEEAFIQENLGEFPGRFTDQGDEQPTPSLKLRPSGDDADAPGAQGPAADETISKELGSKEKVSKEGGSKVPATKAPASQPKAAKSPAAAAQPGSKAKDAKDKPKRKK